MYQFKNSNVTFWMDLPVAHICYCLKDKFTANILKFLLVTDKDGQNDKFS